MPVELHAFGAITPELAVWLDMLVAQRPRREIAVAAGLPESTVRDRLVKLETLVGAADQREMVRWWLENKQPWLRWLNVPGFSWGGHGFSYGRDGNRPGYTDTMASNNQGGLSMFTRRSVLALDAAAALVVPLAFPAAAGTSQNITHSTCQAYGHTHDYGTYTWAGTTLASGPGDCRRSLQFTWYDPYFSEYFTEAAVVGYTDQWDQVGISTHGYSDHEIRKDGVPGSATVRTYTWQ